MTKIATDEHGITLSEIKSIGKMLHLKNSAGRKIKDPIMEKNVIDWIKKQQSLLMRPVSRREI
jgi:hypothetical protein